MLLQDGLTTQVLWIPYVKAGKYGMACCHARPIKLLGTERNKWTNFEFLSIRVRVPNIFVVFVHMRKSYRASCFEGGILFFFSLDNRG